MSKEAARQLRISFLAGVAITLLMVLSYPAILGLEPANAFTAVFAY